MIRAAAFLLALAASPALAAPVDRATAVATLAEFYYSADVCNLSISRAKVDAYRDTNAPSGDAMFNIDVFRATHALYDTQKDFTKDQLADYCKTALAAAQAAGVTL